MFNVSLHTSLYYKQLRYKTRKYFYIWYLLCVSKFTFLSCHFVQLRVSLYANHKINIIITQSDSESKCEFKVRPCCTRFRSPLIIGGVSQYYCADVDLLNFSAYCDNSWVWQEYSPDVMWSKVVLSTVQEVESCRWNTTSCCCGTHFSLHMQTGVNKLNIKYTKRKIVNYTKNPIVVLYLYSNYYYYY